MEEEGYCQHHFPTLYVHLLHVYSEEKGWEWMWYNAISIPKVSDNFHTEILNNLQSVERISVAVQRGNMAAILGCSGVRGGM